ncbi:hypothetical protein TrCOL_g11882 [Triparma columacea]|uniref:BolA-like protein n=1 Tax=Triparma columacea TaxID=722753 RepID=A0A9W7GCY5_9STRA|nr:hypothetical protein TrCOL_g11882 [Triparma columacea]
MENEEDLRQRITISLSEALGSPPDHLEIQIEGSCTDGEAKVTMLVVSSAFIPLKRLDRHKLVNSAMKSYLDDGGEIHALTLKLQTPEQYNK